MADRCAIPGFRGLAGALPGALMLLLAQARASGMGLSQLAECP